MQDGEMLVGWGMATGVWDSKQTPTGAKAVLTADGKLTVSSATADIGTGTYTIMTQVAAETLGLPIENVTFRLGDSSLPNAPAEGGSFTAATVGTAVKRVCDKLRGKLFTLARDAKDSPYGFESITRTMRKAQVGSLEADAFVMPNVLKQNRYTRRSHSEVFTEARVDDDLGTITVSRVVSAIAAGRILNPKTARSQIIGAIVGGVGMALEEESVIDHKLGRFVNHDLAAYHVPVNADIQEIDVIFVDEHDAIVNPLGVKGLGELGIIGTAAAIANAVFHATGRRIRDLPITLDKVMADRP